jgi:Tol biopolymer transport system component
MTTSSHDPPRRWIGAACAAAVLAGAAVALVAGGSGGAHHPAPTTLAAPSEPSLGVPPPGTIVFARNTGDGLFRDDTGSVFAVQASGADVRRLLPGASCCLAWSANTGRLLLRDGGEGAGPETMEADGTAARRLPVGVAGLEVIPAALSPDGTQVALAGISPRDTAHTGIYTQTAQGGRLHQIVRARSGYLLRPLSYSPDGSRLLFFERPYGRQAGQLYETDLRRISPKRVTPPGRSSWCCYFGSPASWSPDGRRIAFAAFRGRSAGSGQSAVFVVNANGTGLRRITTWGQFTTSARWSPTADQIVYDKQTTGPLHELMLTRADGTGQRSLATIASDFGSCCAQWSPDGRFLAFERTAEPSHVGLSAVAIEGGGTTPARRVVGDNGPYLTFSWVR